MFHIQDSLYLDERELVFTMIRAQGAGGQNVNKVSSAVHLRFDVRASSLPAEVQDALCAQRPPRLQDGVIVIKSQAFRSQEKNRAEAIERLIAMVRAAARTEKRAGRRGPPAPRSAGACSARCCMARSSGCAAGWAMNEGARLAACGRHRVDEAALARECGEYPHSSRGMSIYRALTIYDSINCNI